MNWDDANSYVGEGEDLLVAPDSTRRWPDYYGNGSVGGGGGGGGQNGVNVAAYSNGGNRAMGYSNGYPRPAPAPAPAAVSSATTGYASTAAAAAPSVVQQGRTLGVNGSSAASVASRPTERLPLPAMPRATVAAPAGDPGIAELSLPSMPRTVEERVEGVQVSNTKEGGGGGRGKRCFRCVHEKVGGEVRNGAFARKEDFGGSKGQVFCGRIWRRRLSVGPGCANS